MHASRCDVGVTGDHTPSGNKTFCYGVNQESTCTSAKEDIPMENGKFDCKDCFVGATADLFYKLNYTWDSLNSVEVGLKDMHVRGSVSLHTHLSESATPVKGTKVLVTNATKITLIDKLVGCPVCLRPRSQWPHPRLWTMKLISKRKQTLQLARCSISISASDPSNGIMWMAGPTR